MQRRYGIGPKEMEEIRAIYQDGFEIAKAGPVVVKTVKKRPWEVVSYEKLPIQHSELFRNATAKLPHVPRHSGDCFCGLSEALVGFARASITPYYKLPDNIYPPPPNVTAPAVSSAVPTCPLCTVKRAYSATVYFFDHLPPPGHPFWDSDEVVNSWSPIDMYALFRYSGESMLWWFSEPSWEDKVQWARQGWTGGWNHVTLDPKFNALPLEERMELHQEEYVEVTWVDED